MGELKSKQLHNLRWKSVLSALMPNQGFETNLFVECFCPIRDKYPNPHLIGHGLLAILLRRLE